MTHDLALTVGSLFSGIGGIDLGLERAGMVTRWFVEWDAHCQNVLRRHWPGVPVYGDITAMDWSGVEPVDVLAGGFPCQPISSAGLQLAQDDARWLWPQFERAIRELRPRYVFVENVRNLLAVNGGSAFSEVLGGLASLGFDAEWTASRRQPLALPHQRDRLWLVAYANGGRREQRDAGVGRLPVIDEGRSVAHAGGGGSPRPRQPVQSIYPASSSDWQATQPLDGRLSRQWTVEPDVGRVADGVPHRVDRLRSLGNAVVPQICEWIGRRIVAFDEGRVAA